METGCNPKCDLNAKKMGRKKGRKWVQKREKMGPKFEKTQKCAKNAGKKQKKCKNKANTQKEQE